MESLGNIIAYFIITLSIIVFSVMTVTTRKILRAATYLLFVLFATAGIYFQMGYEFLGAVQIAVYAGGILVLFVFAIFLTGKPGKASEPLDSHKKAIGVSAAALTALVCGYAMLSKSDMCLALANQPIDVTINKIGSMLLSTEKFGYLLPFEAISILLLACIIGGIVIARKR